MTFSLSADILHVEDNIAEVYLVQEFFKEGIKKNIHVARDGEEAIDFLRQQNNYKNAPVPDLILLDLNLPKKSGREVLLEIKQDPKLRHIPVIILTVSTSKEDIQYSYKNLANCYIKKPDKIEQFSDINKYIDELWLKLLIKDKSA